MAGWKGLWWKSMLSTLYQLKRSELLLYLLILFLQTITKEDFSLAICFVFINELSMKMASRNHTNMMAFSL